MAPKREKVNVLLQAPFVLALNLFGFLLEFMLELPFMIAFCLTNRKIRKDKDIGEKDKYRMSNTE